MGLRRLRQPSVLLWQGQRCGKELLCSEVCILVHYDWQGFQDAGTYRVLQNRAGNIDDSYLGRHIARSRARPYTRTNVLAIDCMMHS